MAEEGKRSEPEYITKVASVKFDDEKLSRSLGELVAKLRALLAPISTQWDKIERDEKALSKEAEDTIWKRCIWPRYALSLIEELDHYRTLKENEMQHFADFIEEFAERLEEVMQEKKEPEPPDPEFIKSRAEEIIAQEPKLPLRKVVGKRTVEGELNKEFGRDAFDLIASIIIDLEETNNERKHS